VFRFFLKGRKRGELPEIESGTMPEREHQRAEIRSRLIESPATLRASPDVNDQVEQAVLSRLDDPLSDDFIVFNSARSAPA
jgi:hypothetical protein